MIERSGIIAWAAMAAAWALPALAVPPPSSCQLLEPWFTEGHPVPAPTNAERVAQSHREYELRLTTTRALAETYRAGKFDFANFNHCLNLLSDRQNFLQTFYQTMFLKSLDRLRASDAPPVQAVMELFRKKYGDSTPLFRLRGSREEKEIGHDKAGYHRGTGSIYMDFGHIHPDDWLIIFVHETLHALDDQIWVGVQTYGDRDLAKRLGALANEFTDPSSLSPHAFAELRLWLLAGLDRGLLAEYRAWAATFRIYEAGKLEGLWGERKWVEEILALRRPGESLAGLTYRYLDGRSVDPVDGLFSRPLIGAGLKRVREELRLGVPPLHGFSGIVER